MQRELFETIGTSVTTKLLADPLGADRIVVPCEPGNGKIDRGTIVYRKASGLYAPAASANIVTTNVFAVLDETVDTGSSAPAAGETAVAEDVNAYRSGHFIDGVVTLASAGEVTAAHKVTLMRQGIVFDQETSTGTFDNFVTTPED